MAKVLYPELSLGNSKTGPAFSLPEGITCPGKTPICAAACYCKHGRMALPTSRDKRARNLKAWIEAVKSQQSGFDARILFGKRLAGVIKNADIATLRIHDAGDFMSNDYTRAWVIACSRTPWVTYWAYTRSYSIDALKPALRELASLPNVSLWLSADLDNWAQALIEFKAGNYVGIAWLQSEGSEDIAKVVQKTVGKNRFINFPQHKPFGRHAVDIDAELRNCPAVTGQIKSDKKNPACLQCRLCLV